MQVDGWEVPSTGGQVQDVVQRIRQSSGRLMNFQVQRDGTVIEVSYAPFQGEQALVVRC